ncbi:hypothetical protein OSTOST_08879 [Ostertagia ostertagi]
MYFGASTGVSLVSAESDNNEDGLTTDEDRECTSILRQIPWRSPQCVFSPIKCLFSPERRRIGR